MAHVVLLMQIKNDSLPETDAQDELLALTVKIPEVRSVFRNRNKGLGVFLASLRYNCDQSVFHSKIQRGLDDTLRSHV